jgi:cytochrome c peroxidase
VTQSPGVYVNIGKAIAAYERRIKYAQSRFDLYVDSLQENGRPPEGVLTRDEVAGLRLFVGKASCVNCHNGPLLTNNEFHNTGVPPLRDSRRMSDAWRAPTACCATSSTAAAGGAMLRRNAPSSSSS